jgi:transcriptional regulator GlxA family with amidase domain
MGKRLQVAIPIFDRMTMLDAIGPYEILQAIPSVDVVFVSHKPGPISDLVGNLSIIATHSYKDVPNPDIVLVPGGQGISKLVNDEVFISWLQKAHEKTLYTTSVCTGSLLLGSAGLLKGLKATTHWSSLDALAKYGATPSDKRVVQEGKIITSAGVSSGMDMALHLTALITDETMAKTIQLFVEYDPQPPFDTGSLAKAGPEVEEKARSLMATRRQRNLILEHSA